MIIRNYTHTINMMDSSFNINIVPGKDGSIFADVRIPEAYNPLPMLRCDDPELIARLKDSGDDALKEVMRELNRLISASILDGDKAVIDLDLCFHLACQAYLDGYFKTPMMDIDGVKVALGKDLFINTEYTDVGKYILTFKSKGEETKSFVLEFDAEFDDEFVEGEAVRKIVESIIAFSHTVDYCKNIDVRYVEKFTGIPFSITPIDSENEESDLQREMYELEYHRKESEEE